MSKAGFFEDAKSGFSMIRLMSFMTVCTGIVILLYQAFLCDTIDYIGALSVITTGYTAKLIQKGQETKTS